jgi:hypothetical protein
MRKKIVAVLLAIGGIPSGVWAQKSPINYNHTSDWAINETYINSSPKRYQLFVELYSPSSSKIPFNLLLSPDKNYPFPFRLKTARRCRPHLQRNGYKAFRVSTVKFKHHTIRMTHKYDTLYLLEKLRNGTFQVRDSFPILWNDTTSYGPCNMNRQPCTFNVPTPGFPNINVDSTLLMPRKSYQLSVVGGISTATRTGFNNTGVMSAYGIQLQRVINRKEFYTTLQFFYLYHGYSFRDKEVLTTAVGELAREVNGYYSSHSFGVDTGAGLYLTLKTEAFFNVGLLLNTAHQTYTDKRLFITKDGTRTEETTLQYQKANYSQPAFTYTIGFNYKLLRGLKARIAYNTILSLSNKKEAIHHHGLTAGLSVNFRNRGIAYKKVLLK